MDSKLQVYVQLQVYIPLEFVLENEISSKNCSSLIPTHLYVIFVTDYQIDTVRRAERACRGFVTIDGTEKLSLFVAMKRGLVVESRGLRYVLVILYLS